MLSHFAVVYAQLIIRFSTSRRAFDKDIIVALFISAGKRFRFSQAKVARLYRITPIPHSTAVTGEMSHRFVARRHSIHALFISGLRLYEMPATMIYFFDAIKYTLIRLMIFSMLSFSFIAYFKAFISPFKSRLAAPPATAMLSLRRLYHGLTLYIYLRITICFISLLIIIADTRLLSLLLIATVLPPATAIFIIRQHARRYRCRPFRRRMRRHDARSTTTPLFYFIG